MPTIQDVQAALDRQLPINRRLSWYGVWYALALYLPRSFAAAVLSDYHELAAFVETWCDTPSEYRGPVVIAALQAETSPVLRAFRRAGGLTHAFRVVLRDTRWRRYPQYDEVNPDGSQHAGGYPDVINCLLAVGSAMDMLPTDVRK